MSARAGLEGAVPLQTHQKGRGNPLEGHMEKWLPIFWIIGSGAVFLAVVILFEFVKDRIKKRPRRAF